MNNPLPNICNIAQHMVPNKHLAPQVIHMNTGARTFFLCEDWVNNKKRRVQLVPGKVSDANVYKVVVRTSDIRGAGTDAGITLAIFGEQDGKVSSCSSFVLSAALCCVCYAAIISVGCHLVPVHKQLLRCSKHPGLPSILWRSSCML
jgi:hypothetical protein